MPTPLYSSIFTLSSHTSRPHIHSPPDLHGSPPIHTLHACRQIETITVLLHGPPPDRDHHHSKPKKKKPLIRAVLMQSLNLDIRQKKRRRRNHFQSNQIKMVWFINWPIRFTQNRTDPTFHTPWYKLFNNFFRLGLVFPYKKLSWVQIHLCTSINLHFFFKKILLNLQYKYK